MGRIAELDAIRGLAALAILLYHLCGSALAPLGLAVDLFFVLSGYLITTILLGNRIDERFLFSFYARRSLRIWPIYYLSLAALVAVNPFLPVPGSLDGLPYYLTYTQKLPAYWSAPEPAFLPAFRHTWTLAVEEQFYVFWPLLLFALGRRALAPLGAALVVLAFVARASGLNPWLLATHCDGLALGGILAWLLADRDRVLRYRSLYRLGLGVTALAAAALTVCGGRIARGFGCPDAVYHSAKMVTVNLTFGTTVGLIVMYAGGRALAGLRDARLVYLGKISYGLYLYHHIVYFLLDDYASVRGLEPTRWFVVAKLAISFAVAVASWHLIEQPILQLKNRFNYGSRTSATVEADRVRLRGLGEVR